MKTWLRFKGVTCGQSGSHPRLHLPVFTASGHRSSSRQPQREGSTVDAKLQGRELQPQLQLRSSNSPPTARLPNEPRSDCPLRIPRRRPNAPYLVISPSRTYHTKLNMDHRPQAWGRVCHPHHGALAACRPPMNSIRTRSLTRIDPPHSPETISTAPMTAPTSTTAGPSRPRSRPS